MEVKLHSFVAPASDGSFTLRSLYPYRKGSVTYFIGSWLEPRVDWDDIIKKICILKHSQQDATLYNILYCRQCSICFERFVRLSSGAQIFYMQHRILVKRSSDSPTLAITANKFDNYPVLHIQFLSSWWWAEKPFETRRAVTTITNIVHVESCLLCLRIH